MSDEYVVTIVVMGVISLSVLNCYFAMLRNRSRIEILEGRANREAQTVARIFEALVNRDD
jgi:hypothetical protein